ncbi:ClpXP protease specificity-enhancing factor [Marinobacterium arenosum]|uniref:ClpXP protease specificity-enhancing factor n=1 Tax=Marinobacterium arenosum TaxID=2862496 RepID=UPI001C963464|nr:ClpXP protease specificity-enhancing factor [Marinobacterium arenosum]MBY4676613.1 ClpXP protease specificity-enhancing factor [Marinobacterium arenosum]
MKPSRPYILRALYDWLLDNDATPYLLVDATVDYVSVPTQFVNDGRIVLNVSPGAVRGLHIDDEALSFNARFGGQPMDIYVPMAALLAIYSAEDGSGMGFGMEPGAEAYLQAEPAAEAAEDAEPAGDEPSEEEAKPAAKRPTLKVVK